MRTRVILFVLVVNAVLLGTFAYMPVGTAQAQSGCAATYVVQKGDYLIKIARGYNVGLYDLIRINPRLWGRENWIYPGEVLCVPAQSTPTPIPVPAPKEFLSLEAEHTVQLSEPLAATLPVSMTIIRKRSSLALQANDGMSVTTTVQISSLVTAQPVPVLIAYGNADNINNVSPDFTLFEVGSSNILSSLLLNQNQPLTLTPGCDGQPLNSAFGITTTLPVTLTAWLEGQDGKGIPLSVTKVGVIPTARISECANGKPSPAFVVLPASPPQPKLYRVFVRARLVPGSGSPWRYICQALGPWGEVICGAQ